jgi:hypothetical protein
MDTIDMPATRSAITGLIRFAATEEEILLAAAPIEDLCDGTAEAWAARPLIAHNTEFKQEQVSRLNAVLRGETPPEFPQIDHRSDKVYREYAGRSGDAVAQTNQRVTSELIAAVWSVPAEDMLDPSRHPWLAGRPLWLQVIVRGFWHPAGHLNDYYRAHGQPARALRLSRHAVATCDYWNAPDPARGMARYTLAGTHAYLGDTDAALTELECAIDLNPDLRAAADRDADFGETRKLSRFGAVVGLR